MRVKTGGKQFKLTILKGSNNGASAPGSGRNRRLNRGKNGRKRRPKKIRGSRSQNLANKRPFPFRIPKTGFTCKGIKIMSELQTMHRIEFYKLSKLQEGHQDIMQTWRLIVRYIYPYF